MRPSRLLVLRLPELCCCPLPRKTPGHIHFPGAEVLEARHPPIQQVKDGPERGGSSAIGLLGVELGHFALNKP